MIQSFEKHFKELKGKENFQKGFVAIAKYANIARFLKDPTTLTEALAEDDAN